MWTMDAGKWLIVGGGLLLAIGLAIQFAPWLVNWFGRLPGDLRLEGEKVRVFVPLTSMIVVSIVVTLLLNIGRFLK